LHGLIRQDDDRIATALMEERARLEESHRCGLIAGGDRGGERVTPCCDRNVAGRRVVDTVVKSGGGRKALALVKGSHHLDGGRHLAKGGAIYHGRSGEVGAARGCGLADHLGDNPGEKPSPAA
jgi:hypothetical protein